MTLCVTLKNCLFVTFWNNFRKKGKRGNEQENGNEKGVKDTYKMVRNVYDDDDMIHDEIE